MRMPINLLGSDRSTLEGFFQSIEEKPFRASQLIKWIHQMGVTDFDAMTNLSKNLRAELQESAIVDLPEVIMEQKSKDGTRKWLVQMGQGNAVETVFIPEGDRGTLCVSSQVGCPLDCSFCSTGKQGFNRNLTSAEIIGQLRIAANRLNHNPLKGPRVITNVVMMGMGEPLLNFDNVVAAMNLMIDDYAYNLSRRRVTLSTAGVVPQIDRLRESCPVSLAISLHAPDDGLRDELVPINRKYPIAELLDACRRYVDAQPHGSITFEYILLKDVNDTPTHAYKLAEILHDVPAKINLLPFNPHPQTIYERPGTTRVNKFQEILASKGYTTITRRPRGDDIDAACGQLAGKVISKSLRHQQQASLS